MSIYDDKSDSPSQSSSILDLPNTFDIGGQTWFPDGDVAGSTLNSVTSSAPETGKLTKQLRLVVHLFFKLNYLFFLL